jgi:hypothetical protein
MEMERSLEWFQYRVVGQPTFRASMSPLFFRVEEYAKQETA